MIARRGSLPTRRGTVESRDAELLAARHAFKQVLDDLACVRAFLMMGQLSSTHRQTRTAFSDMRAMQERALALVLMMSWQSGAVPLEDVLKNRGWGCEEQG